MTLYNDGNNTIVRESSKGKIFNHCYKLFISAKGKFYMFPTFNQAISALDRYKRGYKRG